MSFLRFATVLMILCSFPYGLFAASNVIDTKSVREEGRKIGVGKKTSMLDFDKNNDGKIDQVMILDSKGNKLYEELDFDFDGEMDDFCFYANGVLERELVDTNFDGKIDLWVYMKNGVYVERYERDRDYDGVIDLVKEFGKPRK